MTWRKGERTEIQRSYHKAMLAKGYLLQGKSVAQIAQEIGISRAMAYIDLRAMQAEWEREAAVASMKVRGEALAQLQIMQAELFTAWERSKQPISTRTVNRTVDDSPTIVRKPVSLAERDRDRDRDRDRKRGFEDEPPFPLNIAEVQARIRSIRRQSKTVTKPQNGDPRYMTLLLQVLELRLKLAGIQFPTKSEVSGPGGGPIEVAMQAAQQAVITEQAPGLRTLAARLQEGLSKLEPARRTVAVERWQHIIQQADLLNQELLGTGAATGLVLEPEAAELARKFGEPGAGMILEGPKGVTIVNGEVRYIDGEGVDN